MKRTFLSILSSTIWISCSEFVRNGILLRKHWVDKFTSLGLVFPETPSSGIIWTFWSLFLSIGLYLLLLQFNFLKSILIGWLFSFCLMWLVIGNLGFLPFSILPYALPLSFLEVYIAVLLITIIRK